MQQGICILEGKVSLRELPDRHVSAVLFDQGRLQFFEFAANHVLTDPHEDERFVNGFMFPVSQHQLQTVRETIKLVQEKSLSDDYPNLKFRKKTYVGSEQKLVRLRDYFKSKAVSVSSTSDEDIRINCTGLVMNILMASGISDIALLGYLGAIDRTHHIRDVVNKAFECGQKTELEDVAMVTPSVRGQTSTAPDWAAFRSSRFLEFQDVEMILERVSTQGFSNLRPPETALKMQTYGGQRPTGLSPAPLV